MQLGITVVDKVTGFTGIVLGFVQYISGCNQALVSPPLAQDGSFRESQWFDVQRLQRDNDVDALILDNGATPGFDRAAPKI